MHTGIALAWRLKNVKLRAKNLRGVSKARALLIWSTMPSFSSWEYLFRYFRKAQAKTHVCLPPELANEEYVVEEIRVADCCGTALREATALGGGGCG